MILSLIQSTFNALRFIFRRACSWRVQRGGGIKSHVAGTSCLFGVKAGPKGLLAGDLFELSTELVQQKANLGGFDLLGSDRTKIKSDAQFEQVEAVKRFKLTGLVVVGGMILIPTLF